MFRTRFLIAAGSLAAVFALSSVGNACVCVYYDSPMLTDYATAKGVFIGKVVSVSDIPEKVRKKQDTWSDIWVTYKIETAYKGITPETKLLTLEGSYKGSDCGFRASGRGKPQVGERWIVFGYGSTKSPQLRLGAQCSKSAVLRSKKDLADMQSALSKAGNIPGIAVAVSDFRTKARELEVVAVGTGLRRKAEIDNDGIYHFASLPPGLYTVTVSVAGSVEFSHSMDRPVNHSRQSENGPLILTYDVDLKDGAYDYTEIRVKKP